MRNCIFSEPWKLIDPGSARFESTKVQILPVQKCTLKNERNTSSLFLSVRLVSACVLSSSLHFLSSLHLTSLPSRSLTSNHFFPHSFSFSLPPPLPLPFSLFNLLIPKITIFNAAFFQLRKQRKIQIVHFRLFYSSDISAYLKLMHIIDLCRSSGMIGY